MDIINIFYFLDYLDQYSIAKGMNLNTGYDYCSIMQYSSSSNVKEVVANHAKPIKAGNLIVPLFLSKPGGELLCMLDIILYFGSINLTKSNYNIQRGSFSFKCIRLFFGHKLECQDIT